MPRLYSYCLRWDDGAAPNPYWGVCTLTICKPAIRRTAEEGDWIVGLGSAKDGKSNHVIYAMKVTRKLTLREYDQHCRKMYPKKIPNMKSNDFRERAGDCIYHWERDYGNPTQRKAVHAEKHRKRDLSGENALLSGHFYYLGSTPAPLPLELLPIVHSMQGHKVTANQPYVEPFVKWITSLGHLKNCVLADPIDKDMLDKDYDCIPDKEDDDNDETEKRT